MTTHRPRDRTPIPARVARPRAGKNMVADGAGWFAVLEVATASVHGPLQPVPLSALARIATDAEQAGVVVQLVSHNAAADRERVIWVAMWLSHRCFWLAPWPDSERGIGLLVGLAELPAAPVSIAFLLEASYEGRSLSCLVRIAAAPESYQQVGAKAFSLGGRAGGHLSRLDGQHAPGRYASAPSGEGAW